MSSSSSTTNLVYYELPQKDAPFLHCCFRFKAIILIVIMIITTAILMQKSEPLDDLYHVEPSSPLCSEKSNGSIIDLKFLLSEFQNCIHPIIKKWENDSATMSEKWHETEPCDAMFFQLDLVPIKIDYQKRWFVLPSCRENNVVVTLGVNGRIDFEEEVKEIIPNTKFYGADAHIKKNADLYSQIGTFYPLRIAKNQGASRAELTEKLKNREKEVTTPLDFFLSDVLALKKIDIMFVDLQGAEFDFFTQLHRGAELDQKGVTICQLFIRVNSNDVELGTYQYYEFVQRLLAEQKWAFLKPKYISLQVHTMLLVNVEDKECVRKYLE